MVIPGYNSSRTLAWCLEGVMEQGAGEALEVIVVESGEAGYLESIAEEYPAVTFIVAPRRLYSGQARNVGASRAGGGVLIFLDSDCRPMPGWISQIRRGLDRGYRVISGAIDNGTPGSTVGTAEYLITHSAFSSKMPVAEIRESTATTGNFSITKEAWEASGGFAGTYRTVDYILTRRLIDSGERILFWPESKVLHVNCTSLGGYLKDQVRRGNWSARTRLEQGAQGSLAVRVPPLALLLFPLKLYRLVKRCVRYRPVETAAILKASPAALLGLAAWTWGYLLAGLGIDYGPGDEREPLPEGFSDFEIIKGKGGPRPR